MDSNFFTLLFAFLLIDDTEGNRLTPEFNDRLNRLANEYVKNIINHISENITITNGIVDMKELILLLDSTYNEGLTNPASLMLDPFKILRFPCPDLTGIAGTSQFSSESGSWGDLESSGSGSGGPQGPQASDGLITTEQPDGGVPPWAIAGGALFSLAFLIWWYRTACQQAYSGSRVHVAPRVHPAGAAAGRRHDPESPSDRRSDRETRSMIRDDVVRAYELHSRRDPDPFPPEIQALPPGFSAR